MKREELKNLNLTDDQINEIMKIHNADVENNKTVKLAFESEIGNLKKSIEEANNTIEGFKKLDVDGIKKAAEDYKIKYEETEKKHKDDIDKLHFEYQLESSLKASNPKNYKAVKALLDFDTIKLKDGKLDGLEYQLQKIKESDSYLFNNDEPPKTPFSTGRTNSTLPTGITKDQFKNMTLSERIKLKNESPEQYNNLSSF